MSNREKSVCPRCRRTTGMSDDGRCGFCDEKAVNRRRYASGIRAVTMHPDVSRNHLEHSRAKCGESYCSGLCAISRLRHALTNRSAYRRNAREEVEAYGAVDTYEPRVARAEGVIRKALMLGGMSESLTAACETYLWQ